MGKLVRSAERQLAGLLAALTAAINSPFVRFFLCCVVGSGKSYTILGNNTNPGDRGVSYRALECLFSGLSTRQPAFSSTVKLSLIELYNEQIFDLLNPSASDDAAENNNSSALKLSIREGPRGYYVHNSVNKQVHSAVEAIEIFELAYSNRRVASNEINSDSSRSHLLLLIDVTSTNASTGATTQGKLSLVDLAGSERVKTANSQPGIRLIEAGFINKSLSALNDVFMALGNKQGSQQHIPFRNSKLTHLLQDSFRGNSKTLMFVNISPLAAHANETLCSLQFANRAKNVPLGTSVASTDSGWINKYRQTIEQLQQQLVVKEKLYKPKIKAAEEKIRAKETQVDKLVSENKVLAERMKDLERVYEELNNSVKSKQRESMAWGGSSSSNLEMDKRMKAMQHELEALTGKYNQVKQQNDRSNEEWKERYGALNKQLVEKQQFAKNLDQQLQSSRSSILGSNSNAINDTINQLEQSVQRLTKGQ
jgi:kinesin family protein C2/C3